MTRATVIAVLQGTIIASLGLTIVRLKVELRKLFLTSLSDQILYALYGNLNQSTLFTVISIFSLVKSAFLSLPITVAILPQYINSFKRVQLFMANPDIVPVEQAKSDSTEINIENASFQWPAATEPFLQNVNLHVSQNCPQNLRLLSLTV